MAEAEEHWKVVEAHHKAEEEAVKACLRIEEEEKCKAAEEAAKKRVSASTFPDKEC